MPLLPRPFSLALLCGLVLGVGPPEPAEAQTTADYEVTFDATWSAATHPVSFPPNPHFSSLVGGTHDSSVVFWEPGGLASTGIESMAESGSTSTLVSEIESEVSAGAADQSFVGGGVSLSPGSVTLAFTAHEDFPELTLVSMLAPSPDWFVGVHDLPLRDAGGWIPEIEVDLFLYDAGTDLGSSYQSPNADAVPQLAIALQGFPLEVGVPVGKFTVTQVPEPGLGMSLALGVPFVAWLARRRTLAATQALR